MLIAMVSAEAGQLPFAIVHSRREVPPMVKLDTAAAGAAGFATEAVPGAITDQVPVPTTGVFAASVAVVMLHNALSAPAAAAVGTLSTVTVISSEEEVQVPFASPPRDSRTCGKTCYSGAGRIQGSNRSRSVK